MGRSALTDPAPVLKRLVLAIEAREEADLEQDDYAAIEREFETALAAAKSLLSTSDARSL